MAFNKKEYLQINDKVIEMIKKTLPAWDKTQGFIADGLINPDIYEIERTKIVCLLCESYGYSDSGFVNIQKQRRPVNGNSVEIKKSDILGLVHSRNLNSKPVSTTRNLSICLWLVFKAMENNIMPDYKDFVRKRMKTSNVNNNEQLQEALEKIGWINGKKLSRSVGTRQNQTDLNDHFEKNEEIIKKQILSMAPNVLIVFNKIFFIQINKFDFIDKKRCLKLNHPRTWRSYYQVYRSAQKIFELIRVK